MTLHIFNPEHDIALATNVARFTPPHAGRQLRADLGFLPALWAKDGDMVLVDDVEAAHEAVRHLRRWTADVLFVPLSAAPLSPQPVAVEPWGWDQGVAEQLRLLGLHHLQPAPDVLSAIRTLSSRQWAANHLLPALVSLGEGMTGQATYLDTPSSLSQLPYPCVLKAPWSSSGRGVRYLLQPSHWQHNAAWAHNVIERQGGILLEPYYNKVKDFGMEFEALPDGQVVYRGLSLFHTVRGAYAGSLIATEQAKRNLLLRYIDASRLDAVREAICRLMSPVLRGFYSGPFGVDMMVVAGEELSARPANGVGGKLSTLNSQHSTNWLLHPCVELNLRRTMGHVALSLPCDDTMPWRLMCIDYTNRYHFRIQDTTENLLNTHLV